MGSAGAKKKEAKNRYREGPNVTGQTVKMGQMFNKGQSVRNGNVSCETMLTPSVQEAAMAATELSHWKTMILHNGNKKA